MQFSRALIALFFISAAFFLVPVFTRADDPITSDDITVTMTPQVPGPNESVTIQLQSYATDLDKSLITWSVNNAQELSGTGATKFTLTTGAVGVISNIDFSIAIDGQQSITERVSINPSDVDMLVESVDGYAPPFYRGLVIPAPESTVRVVAMPAVIEGNTPLTNADMVFTWSKDGDVDQDNSGYGKNVYTFQLSPLETSEDISVTADAVVGTFEADGDVTVTPRQPEIVFYEFQPLLGLLQNHALINTATLSGNELTVDAEPFFFSPKSAFAQDLTFNWTLDGNAITPTSARQNEVTFTKSDPNKTGTASLSLSLNQTQSLFQQATQSLSISY